MQDLPLVRVIARAFLAGEPSEPEVVARLGWALGKKWRWIGPLVRRYIASITGQTRPRVREVVHFLRTDAGFQRTLTRYSDEISIGNWLTGPQTMQPAPAAKNWEVPAIESVGELAEWLGVTTLELLWFADLKGLAYRSNRAKLSHYHYRILDKRYGNIRLIEMPKRRLKDMQRQILTQILGKIPPHPAVHGFVKGRSIKSFVAPHVGRRVILRMDLQDFFPSFPAARIQNLFRTMGYPEPVADLLGGMCTNAVPRDVWKSPSLGVDPVRWREARVLYSKPHLPQGSPTSPALANICSYRLDCRLAGLTKSAGGQYTRYADDMAFSGDHDFERRMELFSTHVAAILMEEGFVVNFHKTRIMRQGVRQYLAGIVANQRMNVIRADFDRLKAALTNCVRSGPASQNRDVHPRFREHLEGRVVFVEMVNANKGKRLRKIFQQIRWE